MAFGPILLGSGVLAMGVTYRCRSPEPTEATEAVRLGVIDLSMPKFHSIAYGMRRTGSELKSNCGVDGCPATGRKDAAEGEGLKVRVETTEGVFWPGMPRLRAPKETPAAQGQPIRTAWVAWIRLLL